jgi:hypothetical protein
VDGFSSKEHSAQLGLISGIDGDGARFSARFRQNNQVDLVDLLSRTRRVA